MLIGGCGPDVELRVKRVASTLGLEVTSRGGVVLAAPPNELATATNGSIRVWLSGRVDAHDGVRSSGHAAAVAAEHAASATSGGQPPLTGSYVLVTHDATNGIVLVAHDHLGSRTLCWAKVASGTLFAGHISELLPMLDTTPSPDRVAAVRWLDRHSLPLERSLFTGIHRLPAGWALRVVGATANAVRVWQPRFRDPCFSDRQEASEFLVSETFAAVERASADLQRPAVKLSGGLDSASVAAALAACRHERHALALGGSFPDYPDTDEAPLLRSTAAHTGLDLIEIPYSDTPIAAAIDPYVRRWRLPPGSPNIPVWSELMVRAIEQGVDGLLDGEGGDETFGLFPFLIGDRLRRGKWGAAWSLAGRLPGMGAAPDLRLRTESLRIYGVSGAVPIALQRWRRRLRPLREGISPLIQQRDVTALVATDDQWEWKVGDGPLWWRWATDRLINSPERQDASGELARASSDAGLSLRHPLMHDPRLINAALSVPPEFQFDGSRDRPMMRDGLIGYIPEPVRTRHAKSFFDEVIARPLLGSEFAALHAQLGDRSAPIREYVSATGLAQTLELRGTTGPARLRQASRLFHLAALNAWLKHL